VIYIFLQDGRSTVVSRPALFPFRWVGTFIFVKLLGFSINTLHVVRHHAGYRPRCGRRHRGDRKRRARTSWEGDLRAPQRGERSHKEVAGAVVATSWCWCRGSCRSLLFPGTTGILFRQFALTIAFSVSISAFNALTLTPALSAIFLGSPERAQWDHFFPLVQNRVFDAGAGFFTSAAVRRGGGKSHPRLAGVCCCAWRSDLSVPARSRRGSFLKTTRAM